MVRACKHVYVCIWWDICVRRSGAIYPEALRLCFHRVWISILLVRSSAVLRTLIDRLSFLRRACCWRRLPFVAMPLHYLAYLGCRSIAKLLFYTDTCAWGYRRVYFVLLWLLGHDIRQRVVIRIMNRGLLTALHLVWLYWMRSVLKGLARLILRIAMDELNGRAWLSFTSICSWALNCVWARMSLNFWQSRRRLRKLLILVEVAGFL